MASKTPNQELCAAVLGQDTGAVRAAITRGAQVNDVTVPLNDSVKAASPLAYAVAYKNLALVEALLSSPNIDPDRRGDAPNTPLLDAVVAARSDIVSLLLAHKARTDITSGIDPDNLLTPLLEAAIRGHGDILRLLLDHGADPNLPSGKPLSPPLVAAALRGHMSCVRALLLLLHQQAPPAQADIRATNSDGFFSLYSAAERGHSNVVTLLWLLGADIAQTIPGGYTAADKARDNGYFVLAEWLEAAETLPDHIVQFNKECLVATCDGNKDKLQHLFENSDVLSLEILQQLKDLAKEIQHSSDIIELFDSALINQCNKECIDAAYNGDRNMMQQLLESYFDELSLDVLQKAKTTAEQNKNSTTFVYLIDLDLMIALKSVNTSGSGYTMITSKTPVKDVALIGYLEITATSKKGIQNATDECRFHISEAAQRYLKICALLLLKGASTDGLEKLPLVYNWLKEQDDLARRFGSSCTLVNITNQGVGESEPYHHKSRLLVFINFINFPESSQYRLGADKDRINVIRTFYKLGYTIEYYEDLTSPETDTVLERLSKDRRLDSMDAMVLGISSHGIDGNNFVTSDGETKSIQDIKKHFTNTNCPQMKDQHKVVIANFCRGDNREKFDKFDHVTEPKNAEDKVSADTEFIDARRQRIAVELPTHMSIISSAAEGVVSKRHEQKGSYFLYYLCETLNESPMEELNEIINRVGRKMVANRKHHPTSQVDYPFDKFVF